MKLKDLKNIIGSQNYRIIKGSIIENHIGCYQDKEQEIFEVHGEEEVICISSGIVYVDKENENIQPTLEIILED